MLGIQQFFQILVREFQVITRGKCFWRKGEHISEHVPKGTFQGTRFLPAEPAASKRPIYLHFQRIVCQSKTCSCICSYHVQKHSETSKVFGAIQMFILLVVHSIQPIQSQPKYIVITQATKIYQNILPGKPGLQKHKQ